MKRIFLSLALAGICFVGVSCHDYGYYGPHTRAGAVGGGLIGAGAGTIIGHQKGRELEGAAIGAGIGVLAGALVGSAHEDYSYRGNNYRSYEPYPTVEQRNYDYNGGGYPARPVYVNPYPRVTYNLGLGYSHHSGHGHHGRNYRSGSRCW